MWAKKWFGQRFGLFLEKKNLSSHPALVPVVHFVVVIVLINFKQKFDMVAFINFTDANQCLIPILKTNSLLSVVVIGYYINY
jgi:hypothetical protein